MKVRVRYAPSPTGLQHIGGVRTALFNYFFARSQGGVFLLRVEDTDRERFNPAALEDLYQSLEWLGISWDEGPGKEGTAGPYVQSQRLDIHREHTEKLLAQGQAYPCFCGPERLEELREQQRREKKNIGYDRRCRSLDPEEARRRREEEPHVIRFKVPLEGKTVFSDFLLGETGRKNKDINPDPVILKTDGSPTYHLANVIDDHLMGITHVMRAQEWLPSGPLHVLLYQAFGWTPPVFCHLPMVMGKDGQKLSKRHGSTALREFTEAGYLPEAVINYISLLGWSWDDSREFFSKEDLEELFTLEKINKAPAVFDYKKLEWFNGQYIRRKPPEELKNLLLEILIRDGVLSSPLGEKEQQLFDGAFPLVRERLKVLGDVSSLMGFLFRDPGLGNLEDALPKKMDPPAVRQVLILGRELLAAAPLPPEGEGAGEWDQAREEEFRQKAGEKELKLGQLLQPLRAGVTASKNSPPLFPSLRLLGREESLRRVDRLIKALGERG